jgi:hypothetical protein
MSAHVKIVSMKPQDCRENTAAFVSDSEGRETPDARLCRGAAAEVDAK